MVKIFVSVGTHAQQFDRLLKAADEIAAKKRDEFFAQTGNSIYEPKNFPFKKFLTDAEYYEKFEWADIVLTHAGAGTIINAMNTAKKIVIVPRLKKFGEHTDDHQIELAKAFEKKGIAISVFDIKDLEAKIEEAKKFSPKISSNRQQLIKAIDEFLNEIENKK